MAMRACPSCSLHLLSASSIQNPAVQSLILLLSRDSVWTALNDMGAMQVVKVMHGADWDVIWLQRDFGIYIANLFDTGQATRVLQHPRFGLGHMLERLCKVKVCNFWQSLLCQRP